MRYPSGSSFSNSIGAIDCVFNAHLLSLTPIVPLKLIAEDTTLVSDRALVFLKHFTNHTRWVAKSFRIIVLIETYMPHGSNLIHLKKWSEYRVYHGMTKETSRWLFWKRFLHTPLSFVGKQVADRSIHSGILYFVRKVSWSGNPLLCPANSKELP